MVEALDALQQFGRRDLEPAGNLRDGRDAHVTLAALGPGELDRVDTATVRQLLLGQSLLVAQAGDIAPDDDLRLDPWHGRSIRLLAKSVQSQ